MLQLTVIGETIEDIMAHMRAASGVTAPAVKAEDKPARTAATKSKPKAADADADDNADEDKPEKVRRAVGDAGVVSKPKRANVEEPENDEGDEADASDDDAESEVSVSLVRELLVEIKRHPKGGATAVAAVLKPFRATALAEVKERDYAELLEDCKALLAGYDKKR